MARIPTTLAKALVCASVALAESGWADVLYAHDGGVMDPYAPTAATSTTRLLNGGGQRIAWMVPTPPGFAVPTGVYTFRYFGSGTAGTVSVDRELGLALVPDCTQLVCSNSGGVFQLNDGVDGGALSVSYGSTCSLMGPPGYFCLAIVVNSAAGGGITLRYDSPDAPTRWLTPGDAGLGLDAGGGTGADAGTDAGTDAGVDGGASADAGAGADAGVDGGGSGGGPAGDAGADGGDVAGLYGVGCDCSATGAGAIPLVLLAAALRARRRQSLAARPR